MARSRDTADMDAPEILLARHGETEWSVSGQHTGTTDVPLTDEGRRQAERLGLQLRGREFTAVLSSPLQRALETCRLAGLGDRCQTRADLAEWDYGDYEGMTTPKIRETVPGWSVWSDPIPGGETIAEVGARVDRVIDELATTPEGDAVVFAHGHLLRVMGARWIGLAPEDGARLALSTGTLSVLGWERERRVLRLWNDGSHLG
jgi:probable phosphoglycerate mutase